MKAAAYRRPLEPDKKLVSQEGSLVQRELSAKLTEGLFSKMFRILSYILQIFCKY